MTPGDNWGGLSNAKILAHTQLRFCPPGPPILRFRFLLTVLTAGPAFGSDPAGFGWAGAALRGVNKSRRLDKHSCLDIHTGHGTIIWLSPKSSGSWVLRDMTNGQIWQNINVLF